jgi:hypothetical protein
MATLIVKATDHIVSRGNRTKGAGGSSKSVVTVIWNSSGFTGWSGNRNWAVVRKDRRIVREDVLRAMVLVRSWRCNRSAKNRLGMICCGLSKTKRP